MQCVLSMLLCDRFVKANRHHIIDHHCIAIDAAGLMGGGFLRASFEMRKQTLLSLLLLSTRCQMHRNEILLKMPNAEERKSMEIYCPHNFHFANTYIWHNEVRLIC